jgi:hypothetical protein
MPARDAACTCFIPFWGYSKTVEKTANRVRRGARSKAVDRELLDLKFDNQALREDTMMEFDNLRAEIFTELTQDRQVGKDLTQRRIRDFFTPGT